MTTALTTAPDRLALIATLQNSLYPGAADTSISMVLDYCQAAKLDPLEKPVHIVPITVKVKEAKRNGQGFITKNVKRDVIMPGIGLYRTKAARTGQYAGQDEPVFGPSSEFTYKEELGRWENEEWIRTGEKDCSIIIPEWCRVTVYRMVSGQRVPFTATEFWMENYATKSRGATAPNEMWAKRPFAQLAKCAEAQALRKGFPDAVGAQPTAEEMSGRSMDEYTGGQTIDGEATVEPPAETIPMPKAKATDSVKPEPATVAATPAAETPVAATGDALKPAQLKILRGKLSERVTEEMVAEKFGGPLESLPFGKFNDIAAFIKDAATEAA